MWRSRRDRCEREDSLFLSFFTLTDLSEGGNEICFVFLSVK